MTIEPADINPSNSAIVVFDGVCNLCESSVNFIIARDPQAKFKFVSAQSDLGKALQQQAGIDALNDETVILLKAGRVYTHSDAGLEIARDLSGAWPLLHYAKVLPAGLRNRVYRLIAKNRYRWFGKKEHCMMPNQEMLQRFL